MKVKFKKLSSTAVLPTKADIFSAGLDLTAISKEKIYHPRDGYLQYISYGTGLSFEIPENHVGLIFPRSSISKYNLSLSNAVGVIDSSYRGEVSFRFKSLGPAGHGEYEVGDRVGQLIVIPYPELTLIESEELSNTSRGEGSYGSSGR